MIDLIAAAGIGGIIGMGFMAWRTHGKVSAAHRDSECWDALTSTVCELEDEIAESEAAHTRCADALTTCQRKLSAIRDLVGPTEGLRRGRLGQIAAILDGERA